MNLFSWKQPVPRAAKKAAQHSGVMVSRKFLSEKKSRKPWPLSGGQLDGPLGKILSDP